jgi:hypothetical protein
MKNIIIAVFAVCMMAVSAKAQTRVLVGGTAGDSFGNLFAGVTAKAEIPIKRVEFDLSDSFNPIEQHVNLGTGWANQAKAGGIVWLNKKLGVDGAAEYSNYHTNITKAGEYVFSGLILRASPGIPLRATFDYVREFNNGIDSTGTESGHLQAGEFNLDMRTGCAGKMCFRTAFDFIIGHVLTQGNPLCDGTYAGPVTCPRGGASSAGFSVTVSAEFPRRRATEQDAF